MGRERTDQELVCEECRDPGREAYERGVIPLDVVRCDRCWNRLANELAEIDDATDPPRPEPDPDDVGWIEPAGCPRCGMEVRTMPTNYDRWVNLSIVPARAKEVPRRYWWRVVTLPARHSAHPVAKIAVRVSGFESLPDDVVIPAHTAECQHPAAMAKVEEAWRADRARQSWLPPSVEEFDDEEP
ncbi:hypothetical protein NMG29_24855 [Streptomyces cocklensis]|jgi:hypothetical protein|uniref:Uncharacterized protein n=1 Tax=Actinacidiphila cocklensis TaxID=887465 RepID=A0A9W4DW17_9ACTN|nr:hypothetical protein [Actinacidiphila cocklensis]MDD1061408.1 hypothetical protein [Actinacidiphila cocklensis]CAG6397417.1 conserved hypothetical protein [Actinacidiphila cocklensis]